MSNRFANDEKEWLEPDGLGGFASGTVSGERTRRYHALLLVATTPPTGRMVLVNGFDAWIEIAGLQPGATADSATPTERFALSTQRYAADVRHPDGAGHIESFESDPWPSWTFRVGPNIRIQQEIFVPNGRPAVALTWRLLDPVPSEHTPIRLVVRPFLSGRDYHATHHENSTCRWDARVSDGLVVWHPYDGVPAVVSRANGVYTHAPDWYRHFLYQRERERGLDDQEDLFAPGWLTWDLSSWTEATWSLEATDDTDIERSADEVTLVREWRTREERRRFRFVSPLHRAADAYIVRRGKGKTLVAGYPWFTDWGRDTFIAMRGLCLATGRMDEARRILLQWATVVSEGMLPNRFPDSGDQPEFNSVDASLWFIIAVRDLVEAADRGSIELSAADREALSGAVSDILDGYARGTRYGIRLDTDGLLACGEPGLQLTWMDAKIGEWVVTPRVGKPVEIQALWLNALGFAARSSSRWQPALEHGRRSFADRFWNADGQYLYDVVDVDHEPGRVDPTFRPNQIFAVGGLPDSILDAQRARLVVDQVERRLLTPMGLRSLAPGERGYAAYYNGGPSERDAAYHQGAVWPWLMGPFVEAWLTVRSDTAEARSEAAERFLAPLIAHLGEAGIGHVSEIADAEAPFAPRGCPFQAWSVGELLRINSLIDARPKGLAYAKNPV